MALKSRMRSKIFSTMYFGGKSSLYSENGPREQEGGYSESQVEEGKGQIKGGVFGF